MSQENQSSLRFSLEESLWFRKGQEVEELVSISLDPDITIQENDQYITIRGSLELTGEYISFPESNPSEEDTLSAQKYVQTIEEREEGICEFSHRFPVDITIPNNRIQSIYDIDVVVESFDYMLPERSCLKLSAELMISGLYGSQQNDIQTADERAENEEENIEQEQEIEVLYRSSGSQSNADLGEEDQDIAENHEEDYSHLFSAEARKQPEEESIMETNHFSNFSYQSQDEAFNQQEETFDDERDPLNEHLEVTVEKQTYSTEEYVEKPFHSSEESSSSSSTSSAGPSKLKHFKNKIVEKLTKKKSMSLTEFFARKEEGGEDQVKVKICIVQKGETLSQLAERYDVTQQKLLQVNQLELNQDVYEGQVLYIPETLAKK